MKYVSLAWLNHFFLERGLMVYSPQNNESLVISLIYLAKMNLLGKLLLVLAHQEGFYVDKVSSSTY